ncbi:GNAT family N-acetyltransferase [Marinimicrobium sp. ARAG 43.8]|uniref:GNAT family N-acetyltransferase n=1 Tax=Marinimicrobium sp. ARAG 43.8 TaxID=3418719 RepID=UPI003CFAD513
MAFSIIGRPRYEASPETLELWAVNVLPRFWQRGIGSRLVERAIRYAASKGFNRLELWCIEGNLPAERTYKKLGFRASAHRRSSSNITGHTLHETHYIKTISR